VFQSAEEILEVQEGIPGLFHKLANLLTGVGFSYFNRKKKAFSIKICSLS